MNRLQAVSDIVKARYAALSRGARLFLAFWVAFQLLILGLLWYLTPRRIFEGTNHDVVTCCKRNPANAELSAAFASWANELRESQFGWILVSQREDLQLRAFNRIKHLSIAEF